MRLPILHPFALTALLASLLPTSISAASEVAKLIGTDARSLTIRVQVPKLEVAAPDEDGRSILDVRGFDQVALPGRPQLPYVSVLIAVPPGARAVARVVAGGAEETRENLRLPINARPGFREDGKLGIIPTLEPTEPIVDGVWPRTEAEVGENVTMRRQRLAVVRIYPLRYDESARRLIVRSELTVRVEFTGATASLDGSATPAEDRHWDPVFESAVLNHEQGKPLEGARDSSHEPSSWISVRKPRPGRRRFRIRRGRARGEGASRQHRRLRRFPTMRSPHRATRPASRSAR